MRNTEPGTALIAFVHIDKLKCTGYLLDAFQFGSDSESTDINRKAVAEGSQAQARSAAAPGSSANLIEALKGRHKNPDSRCGFLQKPTVMTCILSVLRGSSVFAKDPGAAALRACAWLPSATASRLMLLDSESKLFEKRVKQMCGLQNQER